MDQELVADELEAQADDDWGRLIKHALYYWLLLAKGHFDKLPQELFQPAHHRQKEEDSK